MENLPNCPFHSRKPLQFLILTQQTCKLICQVCLQNEGKQNNKQDIIDLFQMVQSVNSFKQKFPQIEMYPVYLLTDIQFHLQNLLSIRHKVESIQILFTDISKQLEGQIKETEILIHQYKKFDEKISYDNRIRFYSLLNVIQSQNENFNADIKQQLEFPIFERIQELKQTSTTEIIGQQQQLINLNFKFLNLKEIEEFVTAQNLCDWLTQQYQNLMIQYKKSQIDTSDQWAISAVQQFENRKVLNTTLLYQAKDNDLNYEKLINKVQGERNVIFIFKSKNQNIFGAYTPITWQLGDQPQEGIPNQNNSFIFSYTQKRIYPIKQECNPWTQCLNKNFLFFGGTGDCDQDLLIRADFQSGHSQLGRSYFSPEANSNDHNNVLFSDMKPNIIECRIYKLLLQ